VELVSGSDLKAYSVVCGSFGVKANAEGLKDRLDADGYNAKVVYAAEKNMYRVVAASFDDRGQAAQARDEFKARYSSNADFQKAWLLYRVY
jgi:cell division protein FtsN